MSGSAEKGKMKIFWYHKFSEGVIYIFCIVPYVFTKAVIMIPNKNPIEEDPF